MASKKKMLLNKIERIKRGDPAETRSRAARNRKRNYLKEIEDKAEIQEEVNATL